MGGRGGGREINYSHSLNLILLTTFSNLGRELPRARKLPSQGDKGAVSASHSIPRRKSPFRRQNSRAAGVFVESRIW